MRIKANAKQSKVNQLARGRALAAEDDRAIKHPVQTWSARMPAYTYTAACSDPGKREPPKAVIEARRRYLNGG